ncbi:MAG: hypothetical protein M3292_04625, partial [Actinomycetota bacterium]|nr:hypothetical protein [Actinomycetota bacterium]
LIHLTATRTGRERDLWLRIGVAAAAVGIALADPSVFVAVPLLVALLALLVAVELGHEEHRPETAGLEVP